MRALVLSLCFSLVLVAPVSASSQNVLAHHDGLAHDGLAKVPQNILDGLDALHHDHPDDAEAAWRKDSSLLPPGKASVALRGFRFNDGEYQGFELIATQDITQRTRVIYLVLNYERQPHFIKFLTYRTDKEWIVLQLDLNVDVTAMETALANTPHN